MKRLLSAILLVLGMLLPINFAANAEVLSVSQDRLTGYNRSLFKLWIDADRDGCNTRAEVLIEEAIEKPKVGAKCVISGGKWLSPYDAKVRTKISELDIDHLIEF